MFRQIISFIIFFSFFFAGIVGFLALQKEKKIIVKNVFFYAVGCSILALAALALIVYIF